jgi:hypothetical protein
MQFISSEKFKFFPVTFDNVTIPFGEIKHIKNIVRGQDAPYVEICTTDGVIHFPNISFDEATQIYKSAFTYSDA